MIPLPELPQRRARALLAACLVAFLAMAGSLAVTKNPFNDEAILSLPAYNLLTKGVLGMDKFEQATMGHVMGGNLDKYTYWQMPVHFFLQIPLYALFGYQLFALRFLSVAFGLVVILAWYVITRKLLGSERLALAVTLFLSFDYALANAASVGRNDIIAAGFAFAAWAAYLTLREHDVRWAVFIPHTLIALAGLTHPVGGLLGGLGLVYLTFSRKWGLPWVSQAKRVDAPWLSPFSPRLLALALLPYLIGAAAWGSYILKAPDVFWAQFGSQTVGSNRTSYLLQPWLGLYAEVMERYAPAFWGTEGVTKFVRLRMIMLLAYLAGTAACFLVGDLRRRPGVRALLVLTGIFLAYLIAGEGTKQRPYLVYIVPLYVSLLAIWVAWLWQRRSLPRPFILAGVCALLLLHAGSNLYRVYLNQYQWEFSQVAAAIRARGAPSAFVIGPMKLGFGLGPDANYIDDPVFGCLSGKRAAFIALEEETDLLTRDYLAKLPLRACVDQRLNSMKLVFEHGRYRLYAAK